MNKYISTNELYHHGIKGMKWGVRRYQNKNGSLTNAGKKRYNDSNTKQKSTHRSRLEETFMSRGMTRKEAEKAADKRIKIEKVLAVTAGVTVAAATAYVINKKIKERTDGLIKAGSTMKRIEGQAKQGLFVNKNTNLHDSFYVTDNDYDHHNYREAFGYMKKANPNYGKAYQLNIEATQDIKIASQKRAKETLKDLLYNNKDFKDNLNSRDIGWDLRGKHKIDPKHLKALQEGKKIPDRIMQKIYDNYNSNLVGKSRNLSEETTRKMFYDALKKQGYGGIQDINDLKWSHLRGKNPLIVFDKSKTNVSKIVDITNDVSKSKQISAYNEMKKMVGRQKVASMLPGMAAISTGALARELTLDYSNYGWAKTKEKIKKKQNSKK